MASVQSLWDLQNLVVNGISEIQYETKREREREREREGEIYSTRVICDTFKI